MHLHAESCMICTWQASAILSSGWGPNAPTVGNDTRWAFKPFSALSASLLASHSQSWLLPVPLHNTA